VAKFIGDGLAANQGAVVVTTPAHGASIREQLTAMGVGSQGRIGRGELLMFDADEVLSHLMVGNRPDAQRFSDLINPLMDKAAGSRTRPVRIYGDMVELLWRSGREDAAISLEMLGHQLIAARKCSILCGYSTAVGHGEGFDSICARHSHVVPPHTAV